MKRFWSKVDKRGPDECWPWTAANIKGRGVIRIAGRNILAPRVSWELHNGPIPEGKWVLHTCDNPPCVNPAHPFLGDRLVNIADCMAKGRTTRGLRHGQCKLTDEQVIAIRHANGFQRDIAAQFGISQTHVCEIRTGKKRVYA